MQNDVASTEPVYQEVTHTRAQTAAGSDGFFSQLGVVSILSASCIAIALASFRFGMTACAYMAIICYLVCQQERGLIPM